MRAESHARLVDVLYDSGRRGDAAAIAREALRLRRDALGPVHADVATSLDIDRRALGNDHPEVATRVINLAVLLRDQGRPDAAAQLAREGVDIRRRILGDAHPSYANALDVLAGTREDRGEYAEAERLLREALAIARKSYGEVNLNTARLQYNLGWVLSKQGAYDAADPLLRAAVVNIPKTYGPTYRGARMAVAGLAHNLNGQGRVSAAEATARDALAKYREAPDDRLVATALVALSHALVAQRRPGDAIPHLREALGVVDRDPPARLPWFKGEIQSTLGSALAAQGDAGAERLLLAGYEALRGVPATPRPRLRTALERLVDFYSAAGRTADAASWRACLLEHESSAVKPSAGAPN